MIFLENKDKRYVHNCPNNLTKCSFYLRPSSNRDLAKYTVILSPSLRGGKLFNMENSVTFLPKYAPMNHPTCIIVWNTRGTNIDFFRCNFRELINTLKQCMVDLLETKIDNHLGIKDDFGFVDFWKFLLTEI